MRTLVVGIGALGGIIATRLASVGRPVHLATRDHRGAETLVSVGLEVTGVGGVARAPGERVAALDQYRQEAPFDLIILATKATDAVKVAPDLIPLLDPGGCLLPIQNGAVSQILGEELGRKRVLGGLSNLAGTLVSPGRFEQTNGGHILIGEIDGGVSERSRRVRMWLGRSVEVRETTNLRGALWSKLLLNCSVTTLGAVGGCTMREYIRWPFGIEAFRRTYDEALSICLASGAEPEAMVVQPIPPRWGGGDGARGYREWMERVAAAYGDLTPSMLQDFQRGRSTEIGYINRYVVEVAERLGLPAPVNDRIVRIVRAIEAGVKRPSSHFLRVVAATSAEV